MADPSTADDERRDLSRAERLVTWTDRRYLDPLVGLVLPGIGDALGALAGLYLVAIARRRGAPHIVVARMLVNIAFDTLLGLVPFLGDLFDFAWKANSRNLALLKARADESPRLRAHPLDFLWVGGAALLLIAAIAAPFVLAVVGWRALARPFSLTS